MSRAVLLAISPKWCDLILSGKKKIEIRKSFPFGDTPFTVYLYKTKTGALQSDPGAGKIVGQFTCTSCACYDYIYDMDNCEDGCYNIDSEHLEFTQIPYSEFEVYGGQDRLYGWIVTRVITYTTPIAIDNFRKCGYIAAVDKDLFESSEDIEERFKVARPPQSYVFVEDLYDSILARANRKRLTETLTLMDNIKSTTILDAYYDLDTPEAVINTFINLHMHDESGEAFVVAKALFELMKRKEI